MGFGCTDRILIHTGTGNGPRSVLPLTSNQPIGPMALEGYVSVIRPHTNTAPFETWWSIASNARQRGDKLAYEVSIAQYNRAVNLECDVLWVADEP